LRLKLTLKNALPEDIATSAGISFSINHMAAVVIPALLGMVWIIHSSWFLYIALRFHQQKTEKSSV